MSGAGVMVALKESAQAFWSARESRERQMLIVAAVVTVFALVYVVCFDPALSGRAKLNKELPLLRQQSAELQALSKHAAELSHAGVAHVDPVTHDQIDSSLNSKGLKAQSLSVTEDLVRIQLNPASFAGLLEWIDDQQKSTHVNVVDASFVALPQSDMVNATLTLKQLRSEE